METNLKVEARKPNYPYQTGPEIQILDPAIYDDPNIALGGDIEVNNAIEDLKIRKHFVGALYDLSAPSEMNLAKPANQWNSYHIRIDYKANLGDARWYDFGKFSKGHICFQDHPGKISFRNIRIKELD